MRIIFGVAFLFSAVLAQPAATQDSEKRVKMKDLPPAVQAAVKEQSKGATLKGLAKEVENGTTKYEAELKVNGRTKDVTFDETGKIVTIEEQVALESVPAAAREAIRKSTGNGKLLLIETVTGEGTTFYEAHVRRNGKEFEVKVDASGNEVK